jgi:hypothetical protein
MLMTASFFLHLFISASSISVHTALNYGNICEQSSGKSVEETGHGLNLRNYLGILLKGLRKTKKTLPQYLVVWLRFLISPPENDGILTNQV